MEIHNLGQIPISPENPSGDDVRYESEYEEMQDEIEKLSSPSSQGATDWKKVVELTTAILSEKSKNILVASYLCAALLHTQGPEGLAPGVSMYRGLIENFWDTLYPPKKRKKARLNAIQWWLDKNLDILENLPEDFNLTETAQKTLNDDIDALDTFLSEQTDDAPMLYQLKNRIKNIPVVADPQASEADSPDTAESTPPETEAASVGSEDPSPAPPEESTALPFSPEDQAIVNLGQIPISPDAPAGEDVRYETEYEEMQEEIEKLSSPSSQGAMDWNKVLQLSKIILTEKSKNILAASYLCVALLQTKGPAGLAPGLSMYRGLIENFWDTLFPPKKRKKARFNAIDWWLTRNLDILENLPDDFKMTEVAIKALNDDVDALDAFLAEQTDDAPMLYQLKNRIKNIPAEVVAPPPEEKPESAPATAATPKPKPQAKPTPKRKPVAPKPSVEEEEIDEDASALLQHGLDRLGKAAMLFIEKDPSDAMAYRLVRLAAWLEVDSLPPAENGQTMIPPPVEEFTDVINKLYENNNYENLLEAAESRIGQYLFWLDLSRYSSEALTQLGFHAAREAVDEETARYVKRLPGIERFAFDDGRPFADAGTQGWLRDIAVDQGGDTVAGDSEALAMAETYSQAQGLARDKKLPEALDMLQQSFREAGSDKTKLMGRMNIAKLLISAGKQRLALPHLSDILEKINQFGLEYWDPDFALNALTVVYDSLQAQQDEEALHEQIASVLDSISKLSPAVAVRLAG